MPEHTPAARPRRRTGKTRAQHIATTATARRALLEADRRAVDPDGTLAASDPAELDRLVALRRSARGAEAARLSHAARRANKARREAEEAAYLAARPLAAEAAYLAASAVIRAYTEAATA
jgi:hypothetical protein